VEDIKRVCSLCKVCAELKPRFYRSDPGTIVKAMQAFERLSIDFKGPLPSISRNVYMLTIIDEYLRFPFCYPCINTSTQTIINCLDDLFSQCGTPSFVLSNNAKAFVSKDSKEYFMRRGVATSHSSIYHPIGNSQVERFNGVIWPAVKLVLSTKNYPIQKWESVLPDVLHSLRSLLCTSNNATPHELFFNFNRKSVSRKSPSTWLMEPGPVLLHNFVRSNKNDDLVCEVELISANPTYAYICYPDGRESSVSLRDLTPFPRSEFFKMSLRVY